MAKLILNGATSGSITLESPAVSGSNTLTLPASTGTVVVTSGAQTIEFADGSASTPSITNSGDTNTGMFFPEADTIAFAEGGAESMRIDSSGNVLFGTTSSVSSLADGNASTNGMGYRNNSTGCWLALQNESAACFYASKKTGYTDARFMQFSVNATGVGSITTNGTTTSYVTTSDYRLKENIVPMTGALDKVAQLKPVTYKWKIDGSDGQGFIAHELQEVVSDCVTGEKDAVETYTDEDGIEQTRIKPQGVDTSFLVATLTAAIQEQQTIIETLKSDIAELKAKVNV